MTKTKIERQRLGYYKNLGWQPNSDKDTANGIALAPQGVHTLMVRFKPWRGKFYLEIPQTLWQEFFVNKTYKNGLRRFSPLQTLVESMPYIENYDIFELPPQALVTFLLSKSKDVSILNVMRGDLTKATTKDLELCFQYVQRVMLRVDSPDSNAKRIRFVDLVKYPDYWDAFIIYCHMCVTSMSVQWNNEEN